jgi:hypothetical protein
MFKTIDFLAIFAALRATFFAQSRKERQGISF